MPRPPSDKRERLTAAAATLAYTRGLEQTTLTDVATAAGVPQGSVYYYFKTKEDIGQAVVTSLHQRFETLLSQWDTSPDPRERLVAYVRQYLDDAPALQQHGCPVGSLCTELRKISQDLGDSAGEIFRMTLAWAASQFAHLGFTPDDAHDHAYHLVGGIQGAAVLSNALTSTEPLEREASRLLRWLRALEP